VKKHLTRHFQETVSIIIKSDIFFPLKEASKNYLTAIQMLSQKTDYLQIHVISKLKTEDNF